MINYRKIRDELLAKQEKRRLDDDEFFTLSRIESYLQAIDNNMKYFVFQGGVREKSLDFCKKRNNKVFSIDELLSWKNDPDRPTIENYDPILHLGGNKCFEGDSFCYHSLRFIPTGYAKQLRPEINEGEPIKIKIELSKSIKENVIKVIEKKRIELLSKADTIAENSINYLLNEFANEVIGENETIISNGKEITVEQALDEISPKILEVADLITKKFNGLFK